MAEPSETAEPGAAPLPVPVTVTASAGTEIGRVLAAETGGRDLVLRIAIGDIVGAEYTYELDLVDRDTAEPDDLLYDGGGVTLLIPEGSVAALRGATLDRPTHPGGAGLVLRNPNRPPAMAVADLPDAGGVEERIRMLLHRVINPGLAAHDGHVELVEVDEENRRVVIVMGGRCRGCAVSDLTLRAGIARTITESIAEIDEVVDATDHTSGENPFFT